MAPRDPGFRQSPTGNVRTPTGLNPNQRPGWAQQHAPNYAPGAHHPPNSRYMIPPLPNNIPASARAIVGNFLDSMGLGGLIDWAWGQYIKLGGGQGALTAIQYELPNQAAFKARYPAYEALAKQGNVWTVAQIQQYEQQARDQLNQIGLGQAYGNDEIQKLLIGGVSISELGQRVNTAQSAASAPHEVTDQLKSLYSISDKQLAGYWFDPSRSLTQIQNQYLAAQTAGESQIAGYGQLTRAEAEALAANGVTGSSGQTAFTQLAAQKGLYTQQAGELTALDRQTQLGTLTGNAAAQTAFQRRAAARVADYQANSGFNAGSKGVVGLGDSTTSK